MINRHCSSAFLFMVFLLLGTMHANAALIPLDWEQHSTGNQYLTLDTSTGLGWLDVSLSTGMTRAEVETELQTGGLFDGFSYATFGQLQTLFNSAGVSTTRNYYSDYGTIDDHLELLAAGYLSELTGLGSPDFFFYTGLSGRFALLANAEAGGIYHYEERDPNCYLQPDYGVNVFCGKAWGDGAFSGWADGSWLVAQYPIPEPGTIVLISLGLLGIALTRRRTSQPMHHEC